MLVWEDPNSDTLWLCRAVPEDWLLDGREVSVSGIPTRWGPVSYCIASHLDAGFLEVDLDLPPRPCNTVLRLILPGGRKITEVSSSGESWPNYTDDSVTIPSSEPGQVSLTVGM